MSAYTTEADLVEHFGSEEILLAADRDGDGAADSGVIDDAIGKASAEMDTYVGVKYELPLASTPASVAMWCNEITMYRMSAEAGALTEEKRQRYEDARAWLRDLAAGKVVLDISGNTEDAGEIEYSTATRQMTRGKLTML